MKTKFVVIASQGEYSDRDTWCVAILPTEERAIEHIKLLEESIAHARHSAMAKNDRDGNYNRVNISGLVGNKNTAIFDLSDADYAESSDRVRFHFEKVEELK